MSAGLLRQLEESAGQARRATERRNALIRKLRERGAPLRTIAEAAGLTHTAVAKIAPAVPTE